MSEIKAEIRSFVIGLVLAAGGLWMFTIWWTNPVHSFALIREAEITDGVVLDTYEYWGTNDNGSSDISHSLLYTFRAPDGREYKKWSGAMWDEVPEEYKQLPAPTEVEYLPTDPSINRIHGEGAQSILGWVFRDIFANLLMLFSFCVPGVIIAGNAVANYRMMKRFAEERASNQNK